MTTKARASRKSFKVVARSLNTALGNSSLSHKLDYCNSLWTAVTAWSIHSSAHRTPFRDLARDRRHFCTPNFTLFLVYCRIRFKTALLRYTGTMRGYIRDAVTSVASDLCWHSTAFTICRQIRGHRSTSQDQVRQSRLLRSRSWSVEPSLAVCGLQAYNKLSASSNGSWRPTILSCTPNNLVDTCVQNSF